MYWFNSPPSSTIVSFGPINIYWYGLIMVIAMITAGWLVWQLAKSNNWSISDFTDLSFNLIISALIGARLYHVLIHWSDYSSNLLSVLKVWEGGLAIHGGILGGFLALYLTCRQRKWSTWQLASWIAPGLALGQAVGRWGNFFNQELFGQPSHQPWSIPIDIYNRPLASLEATHYQPLFFYESIACLGLTILLYWLNHKKVASPKIIGTYLIGYGVIRLIIEFFRQDPTLIVLGWRWPQWISLLFILIGLFLFLRSILVTNLAKNSKS